MTTCLTRREFVYQSALIAAALPLPRRGSSRAITLRLGFVDASGAAARLQHSGFDMGVEEAKHAAQLFGGTIEARSIGEPPRVDGLSAVIGGGEAGPCATWAKNAERLGIVFMNIGCTSDDARGTACSRFAFHVIPSDAMIRDARTMAGDPASDVVAWDSSLSRFGADTLNQRYRSRFNQPMTADAWAGWIAVKILWEAALRQRSGDASALAAFLDRESTQFDGHKGQPLSFRSWDHQLRQPVYVIAPASRALREVPEIPPKSSVRDALDRLGATRESSACRFER